MITKLLFFCLCFVASAYCRKVCFDDLGCFTDEYPFSGVLVRPIAFLPDSPQRLDVRFRLFNRKLTDGEFLDHENFEKFDSSRPSKFIIHGMTHNANKEWVITMKNAILDAENVNVITVDWSKGNGFPYLQACANAQVVGAVIARLINTLISNTKSTASDFHLIGHSLGAQVSGYAGERIQGLGRITGLDPAGPFFEGTDTSVRLDPTDAEFVDVIHTDGSAHLMLGLGLMEKTGHVDFYVNGGANQPDCPATSGKILHAIFNVVTVDFEGLEDSVLCSHMSAVYYYTDSIKNKNCQYTAYPCKSVKEFNKGNCLRCSERGCNRFGYLASQNRDVGQLYLNTLSPTGISFCQKHYSVKLKSSSKYTQANGKFQIYFKSSEKSSSIEVIDDSNVTFKKNSVEIRLVSLDETFNSNVELESVFVSYKKTSNIFSSWLYDSVWNFENIEILNGDNQKNYRFCSSQDLGSGKFIEFKKC